MERILVIGKNGNLGSELVRQLQGGEIIAWDREDLDITNRDLVLSKLADLHLAVVFNCAAYNNVDGAETNQTIANMLNGSAPGFLAETCNKIGATLVHFSSDYVFNGESKEGYNEDAMPNPVNEYGKSKLLGEEEIKKHTDKFYIIRTSWLFGKKGASELAKPSFVDTMLELAKKKSELQVVSDEESRPTYIADLAAASIGLIRHNMTYGTYHITNDGTASWHALAVESFKLRNVTIPVVPVASTTFPRPAKRPRYGFLNNTKLPKLRTWQEALKDYLLLKSN